MARGAIKCVLVLLIHIFTTRAQWAIEDEGCRTPDKKVGTCIEVYNCKPMMDVLEAAPQPIPRQVTETLRKYQCGFSGKNPKVCCPETPIVVPGISVTNVQMKEVEVPPPDVSKHGNLRLLPRNCGIMDSVDKITHGNKTGIFEFPWMALLSYRTNRGPQFKCGASIINNRYLLTAAHCITNLQSPLIGVRIGEHNINTRPDCEINTEGEKICAPAYQDLAIEEIIPYPDFDTKVFTHDIGLLRVADSMNLNLDNVKPVCMPLERARNYNFTSRNCLVTGWGVTETGRMSAELLKVQIPTLPNEECAEIYKNETKITFRQLCAGGKTKSDSCAGDSGGPLHVPTFIHGDTRMVQQGIVSFGPRICGREGYPGVYTRVAHYMNWILDSMRP